MGLVSLEQVSLYNFKKTWVRFKINTILRVHFNIFFPGRQIDHSHHVFFNSSQDGFASVRSMTLKRIKEVEKTDPNGNVDDPLYEWRCKAWPLTTSSQPLHLFFCLVHNRAVTISTSMTLFMTFTSTWALTFLWDSAPLGVGELVLSVAYSLLHAWGDGCPMVAVEGRVATKAEKAHTHCSEKPCQGW